MYFPEKLTVRWIAQAYDEGMTPYDLLDEIIRRAEKNEEKNIWIVKPSRELSAKYIDRLPADRENYPLWGVPFSIKDNIDLEGVPTTAACPDYSYTPEKSAFVVQRLIEAGADVNKGLMNGNTPLHFAAWTGNKFMGAALLAAKAQTDRQNENGDTPLTMAAREGNADFVELLIEAGADVNMADNLQHTALHYAAERGYNQIVEMLLASGAEG